MPYLSPEWLPPSDSEDEAHTQTTPLETAEPMPGRVIFRPNPFRKHSRGLRGERQHDTWKEDTRRAPSPKTRKGRPIKRQLKGLNKPSATRKERIQKAQETSAREFRAIRIEDRGRRKLKAMQAAFIRNADQPSGFRAALRSLEKSGTPVPLHYTIPVHLPGVTPQLLAAARKSQESARPHFHSVGTDESVANHLRRLLKFKVRGGEFDHIGKKWLHHYGFNPDVKGTTPSGLAEARVSNITRLCRTRSLLSESQLAALRDLLIRAGDVELNPGPRKDKKKTHNRKKLDAAYVDDKVARESEAAKKIAMKFNITRKAAEEAVAMGLCSEFIPIDPAPQPTVTATPTPAPGASKSTPAQEPAVLPTMPPPAAANAPQTVPPELPPRPPPSVPAPKVLSPFERQLRQAGSSLRSHAIPRPPPLPMEKQPSLFETAIRRSRSALKPRLSNTVPPPAPLPPSGGHSEFTAALDRVEPNKQPIRHKLDGFRPDPEHLRLSFKRRNRTNLRVKVRYADVDMNGDCRMLPDTVCQLADRPYVIGEIKLAYDKIDRDSAEFKQLHKRKTDMTVDAYREARDTLVEASKVRRFHFVPHLLTYVLQESRPKMDVAVFEANAYARLNTIPSFPIEDRLVIDVRLGTVKVALACAQNLLNSRGPLSARTRSAPLWLGGGSRLSWEESTERIERSMPLATGPLKLTYRNRQVQKSRSPWFYLCVVVSVLAITGVSILGLYLATRPSVSTEMTQRHSDEPWLNASHVILQNMTSSDGLASESLLTIGYNQTSSPWMCPLSNNGLIAPHTPWPARQNWLEYMSLSGVRHQQQDSELTSILSSSLSLTQSLRRLDGSILVPMHLKSTQGQLSMPLRNSSMPSRIS